MSAQVLLTTLGNPASVFLVSLKGTSPTVDPFPPPMWPTPPPPPSAPASSGEAPSAGLGFLSDSLH